MSIKIVADWQAGEGENPGYHRITLGHGYRRFMVHLVRLLPHGWQAVIYDDSLQKEPFNNLTGFYQDIEQLKKDAVDAAFEYINKRYESDLQS